MKSRREVVDGTGIFIIGLICTLSILGVFGSPALSRSLPPVNTDLWIAQTQQQQSLTIDPEIQSVARDLLSAGIESTGAKKGTVIMLEIHTGAIKAMVNMPEGNLAMTPWEPGSVMKPLMMAAALNEKSITPGTTYENTGEVKVGDRLIPNVGREIKTTTTMSEILSKSLNTGAIYLLQSLGGGDINQKARNKWYDYLTNHYLFSGKTGIDIPNETIGFVRPPSHGSDIEFRYAGMSFGVGLTITPLQLMAAYAALTNGGTYYQPHVSIADPIVLSSNVIAAEVSTSVIHMLEEAIKANNQGVSANGNLVAGGKTGSAPVAGVDGAYRRDVDNGTYIGFVGIDSPKYIILVRVDEPQTAPDRLASSYAAVMWADFVDELLVRGKITQ